MALPSQTIQPMQPIDPDAQICLTELSELIPRRGLKKRKVGLKTLSRYCQDGIGGILLESHKTTKERWTTWAAYVRFLAALEQRQQQLDRQRQLRIAAAREAPGKRRSQQARQRRVRRELERAGAI